MKKLLIATAVAATLFAPQAFAQAKNFQGFSVAGGLNLTNSSVEVVSAITSTSSGSDGNVDVQAQYAHAFGDKFVLGLGVSAGLADYKIATNAKMKNTTGIFITPGYAVSDRLLAYGKIGAINGTFAIDNGASADMSGFGYGIGVKNKFNKNLFVQGEVVLNQYDNKTTPVATFKSKATFVSIGMGYQF